MPQYIFAYHGSKKFKNPDDGMAHMAQWQTWQKGLGDALAGPSCPVGMSKTVSSDGVADNGGSNPLSGITIIQADTMNAAIALSKTCPHLDIGTIEIAEIVNIDMDKK